MAAHPPEEMHTGGVVLRRTRVDDAEEVNDAVTKSLEHLRPWMSWASAPGATDVDHHRGRLAENDRLWDAGESFEYTFRDADDGTLLGLGGLMRRIGEGGLEIGYWVHVDHVGKGVATKAAGLLADAGFTVDGVDRVEIHCDEANGPSARVPAKLGFTLERVVDDPPVAPAEIGREMQWVRRAPW